MTDDPTLEAPESESAGGEQARTTTPAEAEGGAIPEADGEGLPEASIADPREGDTTATQVTEPPIRVCRNCSTQSQTAGEFCPHCGARYSKKRRSRRARLLLIGLPILALAIGGGIAAALIIHHNNVVAAQQAAHRRALARAAAARRRAARARRAVQEAAARRQAAQQKLQQDLARLKRTEIVTSLQGSVKKDAEKDVTSGLLQGPILRVDCQPATAADATATPIANYTCLAVRSVSGGTENGWRFTASINLDSGSYTWRLGG